MTWPQLPFSRDGLTIALNLAAVWIMLEAFEFRPFAPRPPGRTARAELVMWLCLALNVIMLAINVSAWFVLYLYQGRQQ